MVQGRPGKTKMLCQRQWKLPHPAVEIENHSRPGPAELPNPAEDSLNIPEIIDQIGEDDEIEFFFEADFVYIRLEKSQVGVSAPRPGKHPARKIDTDSDAGFKGSQKSSPSAAQLEDSTTGRNQGPVDLGKPHVVVAPKPFGPVETSRDRVPIHNPLGCVER